MSNPLERQVGGSHYQGFKIQPIEFILANKISFAEGSIIKYICRWRDKGGVKDLEKIKHYVDFLIEEDIKGEDTKEAQLERMRKVDGYFPGMLKTK